MKIILHILIWLCCLGFQSLLSELFQWHRVNMILHCKTFLPMLCKYYVQSKLLCISLTYLPHTWKQMRNGLQLVCRLTSHPENKAANGPFFWSISTIYHESILPGHLKYVTEFPYKSKVTALEKSWSPVLLSFRMPCWPHKLHCCHHYNV